MDIYFTYNEERYNILTIKNGVASLALDRTI